MSLRTRQYREAEHRAALLDRAWERALTVSVVDEADIKRVVRQYLREAIVEDMRVHLTTPPGRPVYPGGWDGEEEPAHHDLAANTMGLVYAEEALVERDFASVADKVDALISKHDLPKAARPLLSLSILQANVRMLREIEGRITGKAVDLLAEPVTSLPAQVPAHVAPAPADEHVAPLKPKASELVEPYFIRRETLDRTTHQVMSQERGTIARFIEVCGDHPVDRYNRGDIDTFLGTMRCLPTTYGKSPKDKDRSLQDIIAEANAKGAERLTEKTVKRHMSALSQFFQFAVDRGHLSVALKNEFTQAHKFRVDRDVREQRDAWTSDELDTSRKPSYMARMGHVCQRGGKCCWA